MNTAEHFVVAQQLFTKAAHHLIRQNCKAQGRDGSCLYRGPNDTKCAVGILITDDEYRPEMEDESVVSMQDHMRGNLLPERLRPHTYLLQRLQNVHDYYETSEWADELEQVAAEYGFTFSLPTEPADAAPVHA